MNSERYLLQIKNTEKINLFLIFILFLICPTSLSANLMELLFPVQATSSTDQANQNLSAKSNYTDYYYSTRENGEKSYLSSNYQQFSYKQTEYLRIWLRQSQVKAYMNNLGKLEDRLELKNSNYEIGTQYRFSQVDCQLSFRQFKNDLDYKINFINGTIPLKIDNWQYKMKSKWGEQYLNYFFSNQQQDEYNNTLVGWSGGISLPEVFQHSISIDYLRIETVNRRNSSNWVEIPGWDFLHYDWNYHWRNWRIGLSGLRLWQEERSMLSVEPFVGIYGLFFGSKTFIKKLDLQLYSPYLQFSEDWQFRAWRLNLGGGCYHLFQSGNMTYTERIWLIEGVCPDDTTQHQYKAYLDFDAIMQVKVFIAYSFYNWDMHLGLAQLIPIKYSKISQSQSEAGGGSKTRGGTIGNLQIVYNF